MDRQYRDIPMKAELCDLTTTGRLIIRQIGHPHQGRMARWIAPARQRAATPGARVGNREITPWPHSRSPWLTWFLQQGSYPAVTSTCVANPGGHLKKSEYQQSHDLTPERPNPAVSIVGVPFSSLDGFHDVGSEQQYNDAYVGCSGDPATIAIANVVDVEADLLGEDEGP